ncbi:hypothetical protein O2K51_05175 [Apibacter raozihei]|uniref:hypothetical protein n=1 Tax=Apibacter raozihei TaxID=2500547 RepID=UPI000FE38B2E|nr:hypothetical protein [Apibacter raozihei]
MKILINNLIESVFDFINRFGLIFLTTLISMIARAVYKGTSIKRLLLKIPISAVIGIAASILLQEYTDVSTNSIMVVCAITGAYSGEVLDGLEQLINWLPEFIKKIINKNFNL